VLQIDITPDACTRSKPALPFDLCPELQYTTCA
jgi:hypothetical protein